MRILKISTLVLYAELWIFFTCKKVAANIKENPSYNVTIIRKLVRGTFCIVTLVYIICSRNLYCGQIWIELIIGEMEWFWILWYGNAIAHTYSNQIPVSSDGCEGWLSRRVRYGASPTGYDQPLGTHYSNCQCATTLTSVWNTNTQSINTTLETCSNHHLLVGRFFINAKNVKQTNVESNYSQVQIINISIVYF